MAETVDAAQNDKPWWEATPPGTPVLLAFVKLDRKGSTQEWHDFSEQEVARRRARYTAGVEYIADKLGAAQPLQWQGDGVMLFFKGDAQQSAAIRAFEAAQALRDRIIVDLNLHVRLAVHAAVVPWNPETGKLAHSAIDLCGHLEHDAPVNGIAVTEDVYLALTEPDRRQLAPLGITVRDGISAYVFPASLAGRKEPTSFKPDGDLCLWEAFRRYVNSPEIRKLRYVGFPLQKKQPPSLDIEEVFVPPDAQPRPPSASLLLGASQLLGKAGGLASALLSAERLTELTGANVPLEPIPALIARNRSLVVLGEPGSGKTTVLRWLAVAAAGGPLAFGEAVGCAERLLPVMVSVGRLMEIRTSLGTVVSVIDALARYFHDRNVAQDPELREFLGLRLEAGDCLILLDGLDEVRSEVRESMLRWLEAFCAQFPRNRFVVSARQVGYSTFALPQGVEVGLGPFNDEQVRRYVTVFERACRRWENSAPDDFGVDQDAKRLLDALFANSRLRDLARNPFLLSSLVLIHRAEGQLPRHRVQAYEVFARMLCETWSSARRVVAGEGPMREIRYEEEAVPILGELALRMHEQYPAGVAPEPFIISTLAQAIRAREGGEMEAAERAARAFLDRAGRTVQILLERGPGQWGFLHLTFQEFFVAVGLLASERFEEEALKHLLAPRWEEVLRLGVGYMALIQKRAVATARFIEKVLRHEEPGERRFLTSLLKKQIPLATLLAAEAGEVLPAELLRQVWSRFEDWLHEVPIIAFRPIVRELIASGFERYLVETTGRLLQGTALERFHGMGLIKTFQDVEKPKKMVSSSQQRFVTLTRQILDMDPAKAMNLALDWLRRPDVDFQLAAVLALASGGTREVITPLVQVAESSQDPWMRDFALTALWEVSNRVFAGSSDQEEKE